MLDKIFSFTLWGNTGREYLMALIIFIAVMIALKIFKVLIVTRLEKIAKKTKNDIDDAVIEIVSNVKPPFYVLLALYVGFLYIGTSPLIGQIIRALFLIVVAYEVIKAIQEIIEFVAKKAVNKDTNVDG